LKSQALSDRVLVEWSVRLISRRGPGLSVNLTAALFSRPDSAARPGTATEITIKTGLRPVLSFSFFE
jgi:hypothetical protein